ncbi:hypothetical protein BH20ACT5_BH20ACT5_02140 [soil metagenome]
MTAPTGHLAVSDDPGERGHTSVSPRVIERIAEAAAAEIPQTVSRQRTVLGVDVGAEHAARVTAKVNGTRAAIRLDLTVVYPASVPAVGAAVRRGVVQRIATMAGLEVVSVDVHVSTLVPEYTGSSVRVR